MIGMSWTSRLYLGTLLVIASLWYDPRLVDYFHHSRFLALAVMLVLVSVWLIWKPRSVWNWGVLETLMATFVLWHGLSVTWSMVVEEAVFTTQKWVLFAGVYYTGRALLDLKRQDDWFWLSNISRLFTIILLLITYWHLVPLVISTGWDNEALYELKALFGHKSLLSAFLLQLLPLNLLVFPQSRSRILVLVLLSTLQIATILVLQSRAVYVGLFFVLCILVGLTWQRRSTWWSKRLAWGLAVVVALLIVVVLLLSRDPAMRERLNPVNYAQSQTATERRLVWIKTMVLVREHPWLGVGGGNWKIEFPGKGTEGSYRMQDQNVVFTRVHNDFLEVWAELGWPGLLLYAGIFLWAGYLALRVFGHDPWKSGLLAAGLLAFLVSSLIDFPKERIGMLVILAIYLLAIRRLNNDAGFSLRTEWQRMFYGICSLLFVSCVWTGYQRYDGEIHTKRLLRAQVGEDWQGVIRSYDQAVRPWYHFDPTTVPLAFYRGVAHYRLGDFPAAQQDFDEARRRHPYNFQVINNQATLLIQQKQYQEAIPYLQEALRINDRFVDALYNLSFCHYQLGAYEQALQVVQEVPVDTEKKRAFVQEIESAMQGGR